MLAGVEPTGIVNVLRKIYRHIVRRLPGVDCMGDPEGGPQPCGLLPDQIGQYAISFAKSQSVDHARWKRAEQCSEQLVDRIKVTKSSAKRRQDVSDYVGNIIRRCFECEVYTFGSVPLRTYLPDGDIDLTIVSPDSRLKDTWANAVQSVLEKAERCRVGKFRISEIQYINAEVKLIKCHVENIVVDISFNQSGGLCTLCFLEEVDRMIGKNHFFKRSIILVKAWCYYESAILGAHHGLISTYALETLVLYIFHVFHSSLRGPLEVLLRFLQFFGKFDWHKYAISVWGPVLLSSLPSSEMTGESPRKDGKDLLLSKEFLDACLAKYAVFSTGQESNQGRAFTAKYLNVVDPLRRSNNLGRSVNQTNFHRIAKVLGHSADKLLRILVDPSKDIQECFEDKSTGFFKRTNDRWDQFGGKRLDAGGLQEHSSCQSGRLWNLDHPNGSVVRQVVGDDENDSSQGQLEIQCMDLDARNKPAGSRGSNCSMIDSGGSSCAVSASGGSSVTSESSESTCSSRPLGNGMFANNEALEKPSGSSLGVTNVRSGISGELFKEQRPVGDIHGSFDCKYKIEGNNVEFLSEEPRFIQASAYHGCAQVIPDNSGILVGSSGLSYSTSLGERGNLSNETSSEEFASTGNINPNQDASKFVDGMGYQTLYVAASGVLDGQVSTARSVLPSTQVPVPSASHGQMPVVLPTSVGNGNAIHSTLVIPPGLHSVGVSPCLRQVSDPLLGHWTNTCCPIQHQCGSIVPTLSPWYMHGPPLLHYFAAGEVPSVGNESFTSYSMQQGDVSTLEHQRLQQQFEQVQVLDYQSPYGCFRPSSHVHTTGSSLQRHIIPDSSLVISSTPPVATVCCGPLSVSTTMATSQNEAVQYIHANSCPTRDGNSVKLVSWAYFTAERPRILVDGQVADIKKSAGGKCKSTLTKAQSDRHAENASFPLSFHDSTGNQYPSVSMYNVTDTGEPHFFSHGMACTRVGRDSVGGYDVANSFFGCSNTSLLVQGEDSSSRLASRSSVVTVENRKGTRGSDPSIPRSDATLTNVSGDSASSKFDSNDLLTSDFSKHLQNLQHVQNLNRRSQMNFGKEQHALPATRYSADYHTREGLGRQCIPSVNGRSYGQRHLQGSSYASSFACMQGNFPQLYTGPGNNGGEHFSLSYGGTGTYLPIPRPPYSRNRQTSGTGRNQNGSCNQERVDRDVNKGHGSTCRDIGRGQTNPEGTIEDTSAIKKTCIDLRGGEKLEDGRRLWKGTTQYDLGAAESSATHNSYSVTAFPSGGSELSRQAFRGPPPQSSTSVPTLLHSYEKDWSNIRFHENEAGVMTTKCPSDKGEGPSFIPSVENAKDFNIRLRQGMERSSKDVLEFGSLGPFQVSTTKRDCELGNNTNELSLSQLSTSDGILVNRPDLSRPCLLYGDKSAQDVSSKEQSVLSYRFEEEDFPPLTSLPYHGQHGSSTTR